MNHTNFNMHLDLAETRTLSVNGKHLLQESIADFDNGNYTKLSNLNQLKQLAMEQIEELRQYHAKKFLNFLDERAKESLPITNAEMDEINRLIEEEREANYQEKFKKFLISE